MSRWQERLLMGPGPSNVAPEVLAALARPTIGHLDLEFGRDMNRTMDLLRRVMGTDNPLTFPVSGTGSAGMEAAVVNFLEPGDRVVICVAGVFGERLADCAGRIGADVVRVEAEWGRAVDPDDVERALAAGPTRALIAVHAETSTGACQQLGPLSELAHKHEALFIVDAVTSLGGLPVDADSTGIDVCYSGTQKCLSCPPGLSPLTAGRRALDVLDRRSSPVPSWYLDLTMIRRYWGSERVYHHTAPVNMMWALKAALELIVAEGLDEVYERHARNMEALEAGLVALGLEPLPPGESRLPSLAVVKIPAGVDDRSARGRLLSEHNMEIGGGLGPLAGKVWRIGLMGHSSRAHNVMQALAGLGSVLSGQGVGCDVSGALGAARAIFNRG